MELEITELPELRCEELSLLDMHSLLKDVMRDLIANARKYTRPDGTIDVGVYETGSELRYVVQGTGVGIPPDEMKSAVNYGRRGSNVGHIRTMGGGFGLTKAVIVTKQLGGRFWIKSELGNGTRVTIIIPHDRVQPAALTLAAAAHNTLPARR